METGRESWSHHLVSSNAAPLGSEALAKSVDRLVFSFVAGHEFFLGVAGRPEIKSEINIQAKRIAEKTGFAVVRVGSKETSPVAGRAVRILELFFAARLDFVLPED